MTEAQKQRGAGSRFGVDDLGCGMGLRRAHADALWASEPPTVVDFLEITSESFLLSSPASDHLLDQAIERYPLVAHGVSLGLGNARPLDWTYLESLRTLVRRTKSPWVTDHLCWTSTSDVQLHDLLPLIHDEATADYVAERARIVQDFLEVPLGLENVSSYLRFKQDEWPEVRFVSEVAERADCGILLDVNNAYLSGVNHGFSAEVFIDAVPAERILQCHVAGHSAAGTLLMDTHDAPVTDAVWSLYQRLVARVGAVSTSVEWDDAIPPLSVLLEEVAIMKQIRSSVEAGS